MLQFIVLGYVPGTHLQITFIWIVTVLLLVVLGKFWLVDKSYLRKLLYSKIFTSHETKK